MTTLVSLVTKDSAVLGCDSLGTVTRALVDPKELEDFFDPSTGNLKDGSRRSTVSKNS